MLETIFIGEHEVAEYGWWIKKQGILEHRKSRHYELTHIKSNKHERPCQWRVGKLPVPASLLLAKLVTYGSEEKPQAMFKGFDMKSGRVNTRVGILVGGLAGRG